MAASPPEDGDHHVEEDLLAYVKHVFHNPREEMKRDFNGFWQDVASLHDEIGNHADIETTDTFYAGFLKSFKYLLQSPPLITKNEALGFLKEMPALINAIYSALGDDLRLNDTIEVLKLACSPFKNDNKLFRDFKDLPLSPEGTSNIQIVTNDIWTLNPLLRFTLSIIAEGGLELLYRPFTWKDKEGKNIIKPDAALSLMDLIITIHDLFLYDQSMSLIDSTVKCSVEYLLNMKDDELKVAGKFSQLVLDMPEMGILFNYICVLHKHGGTLDDIRARKTRYHQQILAVNYRFLKIPVIKMKVQALNNIHELIQSASMSEPTEKDVETYNQHKRGNFLIFPVDAEMLLDWIEKMNIIEYVIRENAHHELIPRCQLILSFLANKGRVTATTIDNLWSWSHGQHDSIVHAIWAELANVSSVLSLDLIKHIFNKFKSNKLEELDYKMIQLLTQVTVSGLQPRHYLNDGPHEWFAFDLFWDILQDDSPVPLPEDVINTVSTQMGYLFNFEVAELARVIFLEKCIENLRNFHFVPQALFMSRHIIHAMNGPHGENSAKIFHWLQETHHFMDLVLETFTKASNEMFSLFQKSGSNTNLENHRLNNSKYVWSAWQFFFIESIGNLLYGKRGQISYAHADIIWTAIITKGVTADLREGGFRFFEHHFNSDPKNYSMIAPEVAAELFEKNVLKLDPRLVTNGAYTLFEYYFRFTNYLHEKFEQRNEEFLVKSFDLDGIDFLWQIVLQAEDSEVTQKAIPTLVRLQKNFAPDLQPGILESREKFLNRCISSLKEAATVIMSTQPQSVENQRASALAHRAIALLTTFIHFLEASLPKLTHGATGGSQSGALLRIKVKYLNEFVMETEIFENELTMELYKRIAVKFGCTTDQLRLIASGKQIDANVPLKTYRVGGAAELIIFAVKRIDSATAPSPSKDSTAQTVTVDFDAIRPSRLLAHDEYFNEFFTLLSLPNPLSMRIWDLIESLPTNENLKKHLQNLQESPDWTHLLDPTSSFKLYYALQIVNNLMSVSSDSSPEKKAEIADWLHQFRTKGGLGHLLRILLQVSFINPNLGNKRLACLGLLLQVVRGFLLAETSQGPTFTFSTEGLNLTELLEILVNYSLHAAQIVVPPQTSPNAAAVKSEEEVIIDNSLALIAASIRADEKLRAVLLQKPSFDLWFQTLLLAVPIEDLRVATSRTLSYFNDPVSTEVLLAKCYALLYYLNSAKKPELSFASGAFFRLLQGILTHLDGNTSNNARALATKLSVELSTMIMAHPWLEKHAESPEDKHLQGLFSLVILQVQNNLSIKSLIGNALIENIFNDCLFSIPTADTPPERTPPKCKTSGSRRVALELLSELIVGNPSGTAKVSHLMNDFLCKLELKSNFSYSPDNLDKSGVVPYVGLKNLGATCYMNSMLQQLFFQPQFRFGLFQAEDRSPDKQKSVLYQVQTLFATLQESQKRFHDPRPLTQCYMVDGQPMRTGEQMDADEFFRGLLDKLEFQLKGSPQEKLLDRFFRGSFTYQTISKECEHTSEREEAYYNLQVEIKDKSKLVESLEALVQSDRLDGDNKYHCDRCNKKVAALRRCTIGELPNVLVIHLKRFEFDVEFMRRTKVNTFLEFPFELNLEPYTKEGLLRRDNANGGELPPLVHPLEYYDYDLSGVIIHTGSTDSGHYYSFIKDPEGSQWFCFNDRNVTIFNLSDLAEEAYGGIDTSGRFKTANRGPAFRPNNAYMLFYQRRHPPVPPVDNPIPLALKSKALPPSLHNEIWEKNDRFLRDKLAFDDTTMQFLRAFVLTTLANGFDSVPARDDFAAFVKTDPISSALIVGINFFVYVQSHAVLKKGLEDYAKFLATAIAKHGPVSQWLLDELARSDSPWLLKMLVVCSDFDVLTSFLSMVSEAVSAVLPIEGPQIDEAEFGDDMVFEKPAESSRTLSISPYDKRLGTAKTALGRFTDSVLATLLDLNEGTFGTKMALANLLKELIASVHVRNHLLKRGLVRYAVHLFMGEESLLYLDSKPKVEHTEASKAAATKAETTRVQSLKDVLDALSIAVRSSIIPHYPAGPAFLAPASPDPVPYELSEEDIHILSHHSAFYKLLHEGQQVKELALMYKHLGFHNLDLSKRLIANAMAGVDKDNSNYFAFYFAVIHELLELEDGLSVERADVLVTSFVGIIERNSRYRRATEGAFESFIDLARKFPQFRRIFAKGIDLKLMPYVGYVLVNSTTTQMPYSDGVSVRQLFEVLVQELLPQRPGYVPNDGPAAVLSIQPSTLQNDVVQDDASEKIASKFFIDLMGMLSPKFEDSVATFAERIKPLHMRLQPEFYVSSALRLLEWLVQFDTSRTWLTTDIDEEYPSSIWSCFLEAWGLWNSKDKEGPAISPNYHVYHALRLAQTALKHYGEKMTKDEFLASSLIEIVDQSMCSFSHLTRVKDMFASEFVAKVSEAMAKLIATLVEIEPTLAEDVTQSKLWGQILQGIMFNPHYSSARPFHVQFLSSLANAAPELKLMIYQQLLSLLVPNKLSDPQAVEIVAQIISELVVSPEDVRLFLEVKGFGYVAMLFDRPLSAAMIIRLTSLITKLTDPQMEELVSGSTFKADLAKTLSKIVPSLCLAVASVLDSEVPNLIALLRRLLSLFGFPAEKEILESLVLVSENLVRGQRRDIAGLIYMNNCDKMDPAKLRALFDLFRDLFKDETLFEFDPKVIASAAVQFLTLAVNDKSIEAETTTFVAALSAKKSELKAAIESHELLPIIVGALIVHNLDFLNLPGSAHVYPFLSAHFPRLGLVIPSFPQICNHICKLIVDEIGKIRVNGTEGKDFAESLAKVTSATLGLGLVLISDAGAKHVVSDFAKVLPELQSLHRHAVDSNDPKFALFEGVYSTLPLAAIAAKIAEKVAAEAAAAEDVEMADQIEEEPQDAIPVDEPSPAPTTQTQDKIDDLD